MSRVGFVFSSVALAITSVGVEAGITTVLDFESPLPADLAPISFWQDTAVPSSARVTDQYLSSGIVISNAALVAAGYGHAASGTNALAGVSDSGLIDYDVPVGFTFFLPGTSIPGTTDYFAYAPDLGGGSGNIITITGYDLNGDVVGQAQYTESATFLSPLSLSGVGMFHRVVVDQTLYNRYSGGIALDLVEFGAISPAVAVPAPPTLPLASLALLTLVGLRRAYASGNSLKKSSPARELA